jgi:hypothetical protein
MGSEKSGRKGPAFSKAARLGIRTSPQQSKVRRSPEEVTYPHNEQILYSMPPKASPDARLAKFSELTALICSAALRRDVSPTSRLGFPCECINFL